MNMNPVGWFEIYVQDMPRAKAFYEAMLDVKLEKMHMANPEAWPDMEMWEFPKDYTASGAMGSLCKMEGYAPGGGGTLVYFNCNDCAINAARAAANGGSIFKEKTSIGEYGFIALVLDTEGNMIGLHSMS